MNNIDVNKNESGCNIINLSDMNQNKNNSNKKIYFSLKRIVIIDLCQIILKAYIYQFH